MKRFAAQYLITNNGPVLKRAIVTTDDEGRIIDIDNNQYELDRQPSVEFHNGIIIPGFVNCHCHLELSHMKGIIPQRQGLAAFIEQIRTTRNSAPEIIERAALAEDNAMFRNGTAVCADICNNSTTFRIKAQSRIRYFNLIEVFGIDPAKASKRFTEAMSVAEEAKKMNLSYSLTPHSPYSVSLPLFRLISEVTTGGKLMSIHFLETIGEKQFLEKHSGPLMDTYERSGLIGDNREFASSHEDIIMNHIPQTGNMILVHNTYADSQIVETLQKRNNLFWCICPGSNLYIEGVLPPVELLMREQCTIVIGTDSLASNVKLEILEELKLLQDSFPHVPLTDLVQWATINGARALQEEKEFGSIEPGKKPGLLLVGNADLLNFRLTDESTITRLI